jgi:hypothetical protein
VSSPKPGAYRPYVAARAPKGRPVTAPAWRLLVHRQYAEAWESLADRVGLESAQQFYDHITQTPDQHPKVGTTGLLRGNHNKGKDGWSRRVHYEISGAGRIDYEYHPTYKTSGDGDEHAVVRILVVNLSSH